MSTKVIVFSKDRPFQLKEYLRSFFKYAIGDYEIDVIYKPGDYTKEYNDVKQIYERISNFDQKTRVNWFEEHERDFVGHLFNSFLNNDHKYVMFGVDDLFWYNTFSLKVGERCLSYKDEIFGYSYRLHEDITFCHPAQQQNKIPPLEPIQGQIGFRYNCQNGSYDWNYPFELCATMYRKETIAYLIGHAQRFLGNQSIGNPNRLEATLSSIVQKPEFQINACYNQRICSVITVNRVQNEFKNPVYDNPLYNINNADLSSEISDDWMREQKFNSIHVGLPQIKK